VQGYDPALELANHAQHESGAEKPWALNGASHPRRKEQSKIDAIIGGHEAGHYFLLVGPKGGGKYNMALEAMAAVDAEGVSICEAHPDLEVFRLRLGKALNFEYNEDSQTVSNPSGNWGIALTYSKGLFQRRDPREGM